MTQLQTVQPEGVDAHLRLRRLTLRRETVQDLDTQLLASQGHSLWTCDGSLYDDRPAPGDPGDGS